MRKIKDQNILIKFATSDKDPTVREGAVSLLKDINVIIYKLISRSFISIGSNGKLYE